MQPPPRAAATSPRVSFSPTTAPTISAARIPAARPSTAQQMRPRAPGTMIDLAPRSARVPGYTGHQPGVASECLIGRSYSYITGFRRDLLGASQEHISEYKRSAAEGCNFEPVKFVRKVDASTVARPLKAPDHFNHWKSKAQYNETLAISGNGRMPGYTGHVPHFRFEGPIGLPFARACQVGDHLKPADGSHNSFVHEEPHHRGGQKYCDKPVSGYSGYIPFVQTATVATNYEKNLATSLKLRKVDPTELRKEVDIVNNVYTPSMHAAIADAMTPRSVGTPRTPRPSNPCESKAFATGYAGWIPGTYVTHHAPDRFKPKTSTPMDKAIETPGTIYLGDLTQEWNVGTPYRRTSETHGEWASHLSKDKPKLWTRPK